MTRNELKLLIYMTNMTHVDLAKMLCTSTRRLSDQTSSKKPIYSRLDEREVGLLINAAKSASPICENKLLLKSIMIANNIKHSHTARNVMYSLRSKKQKSVFTAQRAIEALSAQYGDCAINRGQELINNVKEHLYAN